MVVTDHVYREHEALAEGELTEIRKTVVSSVALAGVATDLDVGAHLLLGKGEELSGGRMKPSILADAMEALHGAVYLASGLEGARDLVLRILQSRLLTAPEDGADHKSRLQELAAHRFGSAPRYLVEATGPDHARTFFVTVLVDDVAYGRGEGRSKKQAEQAAARTACAALAEADPQPAATLRETTHG
jgi:ribonuclease-3